MADGDTIVALSSGALPSGVAVIRLSGPEAEPLLRALAGQLPKPRQLTLTTLTLHGDALDRGLVAWMPGPQSFTGEDCAELQVHGSVAVVRRLLRDLSRHPGVRLAEAGEFTRRAFINGKLDLTEIEGLGDLLAAETEAQRRQAFARAQGGLSRQIAEWRESLLDIRAEIEARLDFADEGDVSEDISYLDRDLAALQTQLQTALRGADAARTVREGFRVALAGAPNVGKSSLLNALAGSEVAIVTDEAGTTRDTKDISLEVGGHLVVFADLAGLRDTESKAEAEGVRRAREVIGKADLVLWLVAPDQPQGEPPGSDAPIWRVGTKLDLGRFPDCDFQLSARSGEGVDELLQRIKAHLDAQNPSGEPLLVSHERDVQAMQRALNLVDEARRNGGTLELAAESLREATAALERLLGRLDAEMVLDRLFAGFCIGK
jgi:tRNA modification GTPase